MPRVSKNLRYINALLLSCGIDPSTVPEKLLEHLDSAAMLAAEADDRRWARIVGNYVLDQIRRNSYVDEFGRSLRFLDPPRIQTFSQWQSARGDLP